MGAGAHATLGYGAAAAAWFEATTDAGLLRLSVRTPVRHAADAAIVLANCDALLGALDAWCGAPLNWRWVGSSPARRTAAEVASASWSPASDESLPAASLEIGWTLLRSRPAPSGEFAHALRWARVPAVLAISQQSLSADELALLEPGGVVLLPESLSSPWRGRLRSAIETAHPGAGVPVEFLSPHAVRRPPLEQRGPAPATVDSTHEVQMRMVGVVGCDRLAGWFEGGIGPVSPAAALWSRGVPGVSARCLAQGELVPWGDGWALAIRTKNP
ncbi:MAG TPA: hypothetical protein VMQ45_12270 [Burkholderiaceae bacterium]|nr:hypothetical protein [Burkholderiaceae bacterium]